MVVTAVVSTRGALKESGSDRKSGGGIRDGKPTASHLSRFRNTPLVVTTIEPERRVRLASFLHLFSFYCGSGSLGRPKNTISTIASAGRRFGTRCILPNLDALRLSSSAAVPSAPLWIPRTPLQVADTFAAASASAVCRARARSRGRGPRITVPGTVHVYVARSRYIYITVEGLSRSLSRPC